MKKVKYVGDIEVEIHTTGTVVNKGDVIEVPDEFENALFVDVVEDKKASSKEGK